MSAKTYKTATIAKTQATKQHGKNWQENWSIFESEEGFEIVAILPEPPAEIIVQMEQTEPEAAPQIGDTGSSQVLADEIGMDDPTDEEIDESNAPQNGSLMSSLIGNMLNPESVPQAPKVEAPKKQVEKTGKSVEQNRPEQNGLKRPSAGSTCAIIWDTCDRITNETGHVCTSAELFNALQGYNECTLRTQYARWRQFNGITGRLPNQQKQTKLPAEWQDAIDALMDKIPEDKVDAIKALESCKSPTDLVAWIAHNSVNF